MKQISLMDSFVRKQRQSIQAPSAKDFKSSAGDTAEKAEPEAYTPKIKGGAISA